MITCPRLAAPVPLFTGGVSFSRRGRLGRSLFQIVRMATRSAQRLRDKTAFRGPCGWRSLELLGWNTRRLGKAGHAESWLTGG